jgi:predicted Zn-dependent peptidase
MSGSSVEEGYFPQGISHLVERLFWCGTDKHQSTKKLNLTLESLGGNFTSLTSHELSIFYLTVPDYHQYKAMSMLSEVIQRSYFDITDIEREKKLLIERLKLENEHLENDPAFLSMSNLYANSSLGLPIRGTVDSVSSISQEEVLEYLTHQYRPDKCCLIIAGSFENKAIMELVDQEWGVWNPKSKKHIQPLDFNQEDVGDLPRITYRQKGIGQTYITLSFLLAEGLSPKKILEAQKSTVEVEIDYKKILEQNLQTKATQMVLNSILGQGLSSQLWTKTVEELLFNRIGSDIVQFKETSFLQISGEIENSQFSFGFESTLSVLEALKKTTVSMNELAKAKEYIKGRMIMDHEDLIASTFWQIEQLIGSGLTYEIDDLLKRVSEVTVGQVRSLAMDLFKSENLAITTYGPAKETRLVEKLIKKYLG